MNEEKHPSHIRDQILKDIRSGDVQMTPRAYFTLKILALGALALGVLVTTIFIFNFISFSVRVNHHEALLGFGPRGYLSFANVFPWHLLILDLLLVILLEWLIRKFKMGYNIPVLYLLGALIFGAATLGFALDRTPFNDRVIEHEGRLPPSIGRLYEHARRGPSPESGMCHCEILSIEGNTIIVEDPRRATSTLIVILPEDDPHATTSMLEVGDVIFIAGREEGGMFYAFGVSKEPPGKHFPQPIDH